jgi:carboxylesterase type B
MFWIHGGGYTLGSKVMYSPSAAGLLLESQQNGGDGVIWVGINYRLGAYVCLSPFVPYVSGSDPSIHSHPFLGLSFRRNVPKRWRHPKCRSP